MRLTSGVPGLEWSGMVTVSEIREHLIDLLASKSDANLDRFQEWLAAASWNMHQDSDPRAQSFASAIQLHWAEFDLDQLSEAALYEKLADLLRSYSLQISMDPQPNFSGSGALFSFLQSPAPTFDNSRVKACG